MTRTTTTRQKLWAFQARYAPYFFVAPFVILFAVFMAYPLARSLVVSLYKYATPSTARFIGAGNYRFLLHDQVFWGSVANTIYFVVLFLPLQIALSLGLALLLNGKAVRSRNFFRFAFFAPHLVGNVFVAVIFQLLLAERHGLLNRAVGTLFPAVGTETRWLNNPNLAMPAVVLAALWLSVGFAMVYFLAALQSVDRELYEAAQVDGAGPWARFRHVTLPGIRPVMLFLTLVGTIGGFQLFELPYVLFQGPGPSSRGITLVMYLFIMGFETGDLGYAAAVGWMLALMIAAVALTQLAWARRAPRDRRW